MLVGSWVMGIPLSELGTRNSELGTYFCNVSSQKWEGWVGENSGAGTWWMTVAPNMIAPKACDRFWEVEAMALNANQNFIFREWVVLQVRLRFLPI